MKTYLIKRTSVWDGKPCDEAFEGTRPYWDYRTFETPEEHDRKLCGVNALGCETKPWLEEGTDHGTWQGGIFRKLKDRKVWLVEAESIEELFERYGNIVVQRPYGHHHDDAEIEIEIYDDYRE